MQFDFFVGKRQLRSADKLSNLGILYKNEAPKLIVCQI